MIVDFKPVPLPNETTILSLLSDVEVSLVVPSDNDISGASGSRASSSGAASKPNAVKKLKETGAIWLTDQRLIFISKSAPPSLSSLSVPLPSILSTNFHQPILSSNYLTIVIKPSSAGGLVEDTTAEIRIKDKPMFEFVNLLDKTRERAIYMKRQMQEEAETLRECYTCIKGSRMLSDYILLLAIYTAGGSSTPVPDYNPPSYEASS
jgi:hypothetical protein